MGASFGSLLLSLFYDKPLRLACAGTAAYHEPEPDHSHAKNAK